ncbi:hypothetical protein F4782DRAFT_478780 [Xylaria castorea]|nr:hypothetical protein F4782DRAFT_478780 [Xylaria castorea]
MYRITGKPVWQEASVLDVTRKAPTLTQEDYMEVCISDVRSICCFLRQISST